MTELVAALKCPPKQDVPKLSMDAATMPSFQTAAFIRPLDKAMQYWISICVEGQLPFKFLVQGNNSGRLKNGSLSEGSLWVWSVANSWVWHQQRETNRNPTCSFPSVCLSVEKSAVHSSHADHGRHTNLTLAKTWAKTLSGCTLDLHVYEFWFNKHIQYLLRIEEDLNASSYPVDWKVMSHIMRQVHYRAVHVSHTELKQYLLYFSCQICDHSVGSWHCCLI